MTDPVDDVLEDAPLDPEDHDGIEADAEEPVVLDPDAEAETGIVEDQG